jgi:methyltransferase (TIGR00027 family)
LIEQYQAEKTRLFYDPVVKELVGAPIRILMRFGRMRKFTINRTDAVAIGIYGAQICRTRYIDDAVQTALSQGIRQLVILGAGFDTRPYRLPGMESVKVFELDLPSLQNDKTKKIQKYLGRLPNQVTFIPIDFDTQTLDAVEKNAPWIFGLEPYEIPAFLKPFRLTLVADVGNADYQEKYLKPMGRNLVVSEGERIVHATVK